MVEHISFHVFLLLLGAVTGCHAFWRMNCANIQMGRIDPIVTPGRISGHVHTIVGSANLGINSTYDNLFNAECTSCEIQDDKSAYWTPKLYYQFANGSFIDVGNQGAVIYYLGRGANKTQAVPFPPGFRMLSGNVGARHYDNTTLTYKANGYGNRPLADRINFACLSTSPSKEQPYMANTDCVNGLRAQLHMQSCWDGVNLYKTDNSHVAYMSQIDDGICPPTHPVQFVHIFIETLYSVNKVPKEVGGRFVFSTGDATGYGFHGDFQNGWNTPVLEKAIANCAYNNNSDGDVGKCAALAASQVGNYAGRCPRRPNQVNETIEGILPKLPGCINVTTGPEDAKASDMICPAGVTPPYATPTVDTTPIASKTPTIGAAFGLDGWVYTGCANDSSARALAAVQYSNLTSMSVELCQAYCAGKNYKYAGVEYGYQCFCDNYLTEQVPLVFSEAKCYYGCAGDKSESCGGQAKIAIFNRADFVPPPKPTYAAQIGQYVHKGCWREPSKGKALANMTTSSDTMTANACAKFCLGNLYRYAGVEYGRECYCGDSLNINATSAPLSECSTLCAGNSGNIQQYCGAGSRFNLFYSSTL